MHMRQLRFLIPLFLAVSCSTVNVPDNVESMMVEEGETPEQVLAKAVATRPSPRQLEALDDEFIAFVHFGPNTFTGREWGTGTEDPKVFDLKNLDTDQWCRVMKEAGMTKVILTVKHHDGYVIYQTRYTDHGIMSSDFMGGKGDVLRSLSESCARYGLKLGVYLSPADLFQMEDGGLYGNGSEITMRTIPKQVEGRPFADKRTFQFECDDYNEYFMSQLFELLTEYGPIHEVWFDGAHPKHKGGQKYNNDAWREIIRTLAPDAVIFGMEDIRWCGNESGDTRECEWNVLPQGADSSKPGYAGRDNLFTLPRPYRLYYQPAETDTSIRGGWFWRNDDEQPVRTADNVFDIYERSVGGNSILLLNLPPTKDGVLGDRDVETLTEVGRRIQGTYGVNLCRRSLKKPVSAGDGVEMKLKRPAKVNRVVLCEPIGSTGERIESVAVDAMVDGQWQEVATCGNVGHKRIVRFATVTADRIRVRVLETRAEAFLSVVSAHYYPERPFSVTSSYSSDGYVTITPDARAIAWQRNGQNCTANLNPSAEIHYTLDGSDPDAKSPVYTEPFKFQNGTLKAVCVLDGQCGDVYETRIGYDRSGWKVDINPLDTVIDCGEPILISGFHFVSNTDNFHGDYVSRASMSVSLDGKKWTKVADCEFDNIINDPSPRLIRLSEPVKARYIRMDVKQLIGDGDGFQSINSHIEAFYDFDFDGRPSPEVLDLYLDRAVTMAGLLTDNYPDKDADIDFIASTGTKFVGRAVCIWGGESRFNDSAWFESARAYAAKVHEAAPQVVLQGCCFEYMTRQVEEIEIPAWAFESLGLPVEKRTFRMDDMLYPDGTFVGHWGDGNSVPDIRRTETRLWYSFLIGSFVEMGCEAVHLGQTMLVGSQDKDWKAYDEFLSKMHSYYDPKARRHYVLYDAHAGEEGMFTPDGRSVLDYNAFPMRIEETPENGHLTARLRKGFTDAMYGTYPHPYLVEFDNWGVSDHPGEPSDRSSADIPFSEEIFIWGYDEITWLYSLPEDQRQEWLRYAFNWIKENDPYAHLQMPGTRNVSLGDGKGGLARAIAPTADVPDGMNLKDIIRELWNSTSSSQKD